MSTEPYQNKNTAAAGDSKSTINENGVGNGNYQHLFLIFAVSLLAVLFLVVASVTTGGQHLPSSTQEIADGTVALADYQVDSANLTHTKNIFFVNADEGKI